MYPYFSLIDVTDRKSLVGDEFLFNSNIRKLFMQT